MSEYYAHVEQIYGLLNKSVHPDTLAFLGELKTERPKALLFPRTLIYESRTPIEGRLFIVVLTVQRGGEHQLGWIERVAFDSRAV